MTFSDFLALGWLVGVPVAFAVGYALGARRSRREREQLEEQLRGEYEPPGGRK